MLRAITNPTATNAIPKGKDALTSKGFARCIPAGADKLSGK
jgi:hypothetical protein